MHIVAIVGSLRQGSMNRQLAEAARRTDCRSSEGLAAAIFSRTVPVYR